MKRVLRDTTFHISVKNPKGVEKGVSQIIVDGQPIEGSIVKATPGTHQVEVIMG